MSKGLQKIVDDFIQKPDRMRMGAGKLAQRYRCSTGDIYAARMEARAILQGSNNNENRDEYEESPIVSKKYVDITPAQDHRQINRNMEGMHVVLGCVHVPFQNRGMQKGIIDLISDLGDRVKGFHLIGDILDMNSLSAHDNNKLPIPGITLGYEYKEGNKYLDSFENVLPRNVIKTYIYGNHEDRIHRHKADINNSKFADALPTPREALKLDDRGFIVKENWKEDYFVLGKHLQLIHGEFCTKYPARTHMDRMKSSVLFAHTHRVDITYDGEKAGFNIGWGGDPEAPAFNYVSRLTKMNWINGFALVHIDRHGNFFTQVIPIYRNEFWYNGKRYGA